MVDIRFESDNNRSAAYDDNDKNVGESTFSRSPGLWIIDHTAVEKEYEGKGVAKSLVTKLVEQARIEDIKILPLCPYAKIVFDRTPEYSDVLKK